MPERSMPVREAREIAEKIAQEMQVELVDVELVKEPAGHFLRFYVDRPDGIALNDLEAFHRRILPLVERVAYDYMEVSSPGADRPLKTERDFEKAQGTQVTLKTYRPVNGGKEFTGTLIGLRGDEIAIEDASGAEMTFPRKAVAVIRPLIEFDEEDLRDDVPVL
ncbi:MAG: ribosome maturation factor RimP [Clostridia bacterium]|nr:ribosome maturation factor RimP [Clostridia bacterium]